MKQFLRSLSRIIPIGLLPFTFITVLSQNTVPGDILYGYKRGLESVILAGASVHPTTRAMFQSNLADRRFGEVEKVILARQDTSGLSEFIFTVAEAREKIKEVPDRETRLVLRDELVASIDEYQKKLEEIKTIYVTQERVIEREKVVFVQQPTNTPVPVPTSRPGEPPKPTNTPVPLPTVTPTPAPLPLPPTNTPVPVPTARPDQRPRPTNTPVPLPTPTPRRTPTPTIIPTPTRTPTPTPPSTGSPPGQPPDITIPEQCESLPTLAERIQCAIDELEKQKREARTTIQQVSPPQSLPSVETLPTSTPIPTPTATPTLVPICGSYTDCQSCISSVLRCGWDGGNCRSSSQQGCPAGESHWFRGSCSVDECEAVNPTPTPTPTPAPSCTVQWDSGNCSLPGDGTCCDWGQQGFCNWTPSAWQACAAKCESTCVPKVLGASVEVSLEKDRNVFGVIIEWLITPSIRTRIEGLTN